jgi:hydroxyacylglutathione hydrolase
MILERATHPQFVSNTYLLADGRGGPAFFVDAGGPVESLIAVAERHQLEPSHVLLTHHHFDHVSEVGKLRERWPDLVVLIHPLELEGLGEIAADPLEAGELLSFGALEVRPLRTPGHTAGMLSFLVSETAPVDRPSSSIAPPSPRAAPGGFAGADALVFTGDTLFAGSVGGVRAPGHTTYTDLRDSIMGTLMELPPDTAIQPGHADPTTVAREWEENPFIRVWRGLDQEGVEPCTALGEPATLVLLCGDYDGGTKAWVRWPDGSDDIVPGSRVQRQ